MNFMQSFIRLQIVVFVVVLAILLAGAFLFARGMNPVLRTTFVASLIFVGAGMWVWGALLWKALAQLRANHKIDET